MKRYKQLIFALFIIIIIVILDIILENNSNSMLKKIDEKLAKLDEMIEKIAKNDEEEVKLGDDVNDYSKQIVENWKNNQKFLACYIEHDEIEKVGDKIELIKKQINIDEVGDCRQAISETRFLLKHLMEKQKFSLENIF